MPRWNQFLLFSLVASVLGFAGCSSKAASKPSNNAPKAWPTAPPPAPAAPGRTIAKPPARESAFSWYSNPDYGLAFRYPRNFALDEGTPEDSSSVRSQEELQGEEPGAVLVVSVVVPGDAYPNTTFAGGSLQFAVNRYLTAGTCWRALISRIGDSNGHTGVTSIQGVDFTWADRDEGDANTEFFERDYAGFANGTCYEFFLRVGVGVSADAEEARAPDDKKILGHLEQIVSSLQFESKPVSSLDGPAKGPSLHRKP
jgi:hypothetical protein